MAIDFASAVNAYQKVAKAAQSATLEKSSETASTGGNSGASTCFNFTSKVAVFPANSFP